MRTFLHKIMVDITRYPREVILPKQSASIIVNVFRLYEYWFGRRIGPRFEGGYFDGITVHGTWEHFFAHWEGKLRAFDFGFKVVPLPKLALSGGMDIPMNSIFNFAVAYDNSTTDVTTPSSLTYTVTGSNPTLLVLSAGGATHPVLTMTYNLVSLLPADQAVTQAYIYEGFHLINPATGTNAFASTYTAADGAYVVAIESYSGTNQTAIDASNGVSVNGASPITCTVNTATANAWGVMMGIAASGALAAGTNTTSRSSVRSDVFAGDSNGTIATGSFSMGITVTGGSRQAGGVMWKIAPLAAANVNSGFFFATSV